MSSFGTLVYKDWRLNRLVVVACLLLIPLSNVVGSATGPSSTRPWPLWMSMVNSLATQQHALLLVMASALGATAFAAERRDRSAEFLAVLPPSRLTVLFSKLLLAAASLFVFLGLSYAVDVWPNVGGYVQQEGILRGLFGFYLSYVRYQFDDVLFAFGAGWLLSSCLRSVAVATTGAVALSFAVLFILRSWLPYVLRLMGDAEWISYFYAFHYAMLATGATAVLVGSVIHLRRTTP